MKYQKEIDSRIDVTTALSNFVNGDQFVKDELVKLYVGKCYANAFILSIDEIIHRSAATLNPRECGKFATISVRFRCTVRDYAIGEHVVVTVQSSASNNIIGKCKDATCAIIDTNGLSNALRKDLVIICRVCDRTYQPQDTRIILEVEFYYPLADTVSFNVKRNDLVALFATKKIFIDTLVARVAKEQEKTKKMLADANLKQGWEKYRDELMNPASLMTKDGNVIDVIKLVESRGDIIPKNNHMFVLKRGAFMSMVSTNVVTAPVESGEAADAMLALTSMLVHVVDSYRWLRRMVMLTAMKMDPNKIVGHLLFNHRKKMEVEHKNKEKK